MPANSRRAPCLRTLAAAFIAANVMPAHAMARDLAVITNQNSNELSILDIATGTETHRFPLSGKPAGVAVAPDGTAYTVSVDSKTIRRINIETGLVLAETTLDGGPLGIALDVDHARVFVSDWYNTRIWALDAHDLTLITTLQTGSAPAGLTVRDGLLAAAERDADQVSVYDLDGLKLIHRIDVGTRPFGLDFAPDGRLFVGNVGSADLSVIDARAGTLLRTVPVGARPYGVAFAQGRAFVTNQYDNTVSVLDLSSLELLATLDVGEYPEGIDSAEDETIIVVANWFDNTVSLIDAATLELVGEIETGGDGPRAFGRFVAPKRTAP